MGTIQSFAELPATTEGVAFGAGPDGKPTLYVGSGNAIFRVNDDRTVVEHVKVPSPLGITRRADGDLLVCGKSETDDTAGVIWRVTPAGEKSLFLGSDAMPFSFPNFLAVAPDDSVVFSDSGTNDLYRADADGGSLSLVTSAITFPNGVAFSADGKTLFVASWDSKKVYSLTRGADGSYGPPEVFADDVENVDGIATFGGGDLLFVMNGDGMIRYGLDKTKTVIASGVTLGLPANGAFGSGTYGDGWVYVTSLQRTSLARVYVGEGGAPLPVR